MNCLNWVNFAPFLFILTQTFICLSFLFVDAFNVIFKAMFGHRMMTEIELHLQASRLINRYFVAYTHNLWPFLLRIILCLFKSHSSNFVHASQHKYNSFVIQHVFLLISSFFIIEFIILCSKIRCSQWIHRKSINLIEMRWIDEKSEFMIFFFLKSQDFFVGRTQSHTSILYHNGFFMHVEHIFSIEMVNFYGCNEYTYQIYPLDVQVLLIEFLWSPKMFIISMDKYPTWTYKKP